MTDSARKPFQFLNLSKDIRLMVYEELSMKTYRDRFPLRDNQDYVTLVNTVIPGLSILATSRQIRSEASSIILPRLRVILCSPPVIVIQAEHLISLMDLHDCFSSVYGTKFMEKLISCLYDPRALPRIMRYRRGKLSTRQLRRRLRLQELIAIDDEASLKAFVRFALRAMKYLTRNTAETHHEYPPLTFVVEVPDTFQGIPVTTSTSLMKSISYKIFSPLIPTLPRTVTNHAGILWLLRRFTFHISLSCELWRIVSLIVKVRLLDKGHTGWRISGSNVQKAILRGLEEARSNVPGIVRYGGRVPRETDEI
ncbi:hypothetical protein COCC4DRAFT_21092 [Bipolaris maydis ATCC 48331]|uniref:Uncharacterized protein n=2 Tax=Cochliobolus heterostrophus TaxID=5016 RepID=M2UFN6_COCH5|nr:uncharacterized protein COCC4DRAFT_21092 [Bipolaris maydis ATCC 48331]EMD92526.1 hypothetical protein COCHEDRAFT_1155495 [Bipolaris maydis C5]KAJ5022346.1 hypothetical protein J3E73DRAFT_394195 [Bipolaris maydis]ENI08221.1 hypothetical protein COCC4DRAFT_21092 [Bipolaris maydis ATCC 48331]KAJ5061041.1 hypothetical protein J3E74DRAFT_214644 [Bipolaris maydis]KAJ6198171.1 hypothetical protein J3E72DRAFT_188922 [Bipolaris maydis]